ncbi:MAG: L-histidine N(alpha)-methyltransferase [Actinomycetota bacterium]|nr:L-histidine N(alpha)-methyltransferase [Actinomycetota bacterium]
MTTTAVETYLSADDVRAALRADVVRGLTSSPKELPPKWFYDERGSQLFDEITRLPEYYPTRREREILAARAGEIAHASGAGVLVELGAGTAEKTRSILDAMRDLRSLERYVPFDVSEQTLRDTADAIAQEYPGIDVHGVVGDFDRHLGRIPVGGRRMVAFLGGTIGNFPPMTRRTFLAEIAAALRPGDSFLLGTDLVKDVTRLEAAYNDSQGVTAAFNLNVLTVINRELEADFDLEGFEHVARFDSENEWIEMLLRSKVDQTVHVSAIGLKAEFAAGEEMRTEVSAKFRRPFVEAELSDAGLEVAHWWTDDHGDFALSLSFPR